MIEEGCVWRLFVIEDCVRGNGGRAVDLYGLLSDVK